MRLAQVKVERWCVNVLGSSIPEEVELDLVLVVLLEVAHNHGQGERHGESAADRAEGPDELAEAGDGEDVAVANGGHGDHHPVEGGRDVGEARVKVLLYVVAEAGDERDDDHDPDQEQPGEDETGDAQDHPQESKLRSALDEGEDDRLKSSGVPEKTKIMDDNENSLVFTLPALGFLQV